MQARSQSWWVMAVRGALAVLAGGVVLFYPLQSVDLVVVVFGAFAVTAGAASLGAGFQGATSRERWWPLMLEGVVGVGAGIAAFVWPQLTALVLLFIIGAWALAAGLLQLVEAFNLRQDSSASWLLLMTGLFTVIFGAAAFLGPGVSLSALAWLLGVYALAFGFLQLVLAGELRGLQWTRRGA